MRRSGAFALRSNFVEAEPAAREDPRGARSRRYEIASIAIRLFSERGLEATTIDDIAAAVGISPRTFFRHFPTKEAAAFPDHDQRIAQLRQQLSTRKGSLSPLRVVIDVSRRSAHQYLEDPDLYRPRIQLVKANTALRDHERLIDQKYEEAVVEYLVSELADDPAAELKSRVIAASIVAAVNYTIEAWAADAKADAEALLNESLQFVEEAFAPLVGTAAVTQDEDLVVIVASSAKLRADLASVLADALPRPSSQTTPSRPRRAR